MTARLLLPASALLLALLMTLVCRASVGISMGLFIGGVAFATLVTPPLSCGESHVFRRMFVALGATLGVALAWLTALGEPFTFSQWLACTVALLAYALALGGICSLLLSLRCNATLAAGIVTTIAVLWLTWPVWLSHALLKPGLGEALIEWLVPAHPLFAINGVLEHLGTWDRQPMAYGSLTVLNQHVFYDLPTGVTWATLVHGLIAAMTFGLSFVVDRRRLRRAGAVGLEVDVPDRPGGQRGQDDVR